MNQDPSTGKALVSPERTADNTIVSHYDRAPITEALIDIQFKGGAVSLEEMAAVVEVDAYPQKKPIVMAAFKFGGDTPEVATVVSQQQATQLGWAFVSTDKLQVLQFQQTSFTFSRLAPYQRWEPFRDEARRLWQVVRGICKPETISRLAVRYVNRLELPLPINDFKDYIRTVPEVSPALPQALSTFFMQLQIPQVDIEAMLILNQQLLPPPSLPASSVQILLDLDLFKVGVLPEKEADLWEVFEKLHTKKNEIFEGCITDRTRSLIR